MDIDGAGVAIGDGVGLKFELEVLIWVGLKAWPEKLVAPIGFGTKVVAFGLNAGAFMFGLKGVAPTLRDLYDMQMG